MVELVKSCLYDRLGILSLCGNDWHGWVSLATSLWSNYWNFTSYMARFGYFCIFHFWNKSSHVPLLDVHSIWDGYFHVFTHQNFPTYPIWILSSTSITSLDYVCGVRHVSVMFLGGTWCRTFSLDMMIGVERKIFIDDHQNFPKYPLFDFLTKFFDHFPMSYGHLTWCVRKSIK